MLACGNEIPIKPDYFCSLKKRDEWNNELTYIIEVINLIEIKRLHS